MEQAKKEERKTTDRKYNKIRSGITKCRIRERRSLGRQSDSGHRPVSRGSDQHYRKPARQGVNTDKGGGWCSSGKVVASWRWAKAEATLTAGVASMDKGEGNVWKTMNVTTREFCRAMRERGRMGQKVTKRECGWI